MNPHPHPVNLQHINQQAQLFLTTNKLTRMKKRKLTALKIILMIIIPLVRQLIVASFL